jgi:GT2 family glycosyltransferase
MPEAGAARAAQPPQRDLLVSIINYRTAELTLNCLGSVLRELAGLDGEAVVVDNRSDDGSAEAIADWIAAQVPPVPVRLIRSATNSGFSGGHNQAMRACPARYTLILNSDTLLRPGCLAGLLAAAEAMPAAGIFAPSLEHESGERQISCFRFPTPASELIRGAATGAVTRLLRRYDLPLGIPPAADQIGWASFACILLRGAMVAAIGPMDEGYFLYFEDTE